MSDAAAKAARLPAALQPSPVYDDEIVDWDCSFDDPPLPKESGRIEVVLRKDEIAPSPD